MTDPAAGKLAGGAADKDQRQGEPRGGDSRPLSDQQEWQTHEKAVASAGGPPTAFAAKAATSTIPIVFSAVSDPVEIGLVPSLNQPGGNVTGMGVFNATLGAKRIELTKELMPGAAGIAYLLNPSNPSSEIELKGALAAARALRIELHVLNASTEYELDTAFADAAKLRAGVLVVSGEPYFDSQRERLVSSATTMPMVPAFIIRTHLWAARNRR
jgi:ABC-type uncharacterized transport system substrate-binding protein